MILPTLRLRDQPAERHLVRDVEAIDLTTDTINSSRSLCYLCESNLRFPQTIKQEKNSNARELAM